MALKISSRTRDKLANKHGVTEDDINQCFANREGAFLEDNRAEHKTHPPTKWFIAETDHGIQLKVVYIKEADGSIIIRTAYRPNCDEIRIYNKFAK